MESKILATRDNKGKVRLALVSMKLTETDAGDLYTIERSTGLLGGKMVQGPVLDIEKGKAKRTVKEQAELKYNSLIKEYKDKGYKEYDTIPSEEDVPTTKNDQQGALKPMLCKVINFADKKLLNKTYFASFKYDGIRTTIFKRDDKIVTSSRGGKNYDIAATYILDNQAIKDVFEKYPNIILDGEIYRHGWPLNKISGLGRLEEVCEDHKELYFCCYDIVDESKTFEERLKILEILPESDKLKIVKHTKMDITSLADFEKTLKAYHDDAVAKGYEGAVIRDGSALYKCGGRDNRMLKLKCFTDHEYKIVDIVEGLRDEDMCFLMEMSDGKQFKAKPIGTREDKDNYRKNLDSLKGKMATIKHFGFGKNGVPNLPVFKSVREDYE